MNRRIQETTQKAAGFLLALAGCGTVIVLATIMQRRVGSPWLIGVAVGIVLAARYLPRVFERAGEDTQDAPEEAEPADRMLVLLEAMIVFAFVYALARTTQTFLD